MSGPLCDRASVPASRWSTKAATKEKTQFSSSGDFIDCKGSYEVLPTHCATYTWCFTGRPLSLRESWISQVLAPSPSRGGDLNRAKFPDDPLSIPPARAISVESRSLSPFSSIPLAFPDHMQNVSNLSSLFVFRLERSYVDALSSHYFRAIFLYVKLITNEFDEKLDLLFNENIYTLLYTLEDLILRGSLLILMRKEDIIGY